MLISVCFDSWFTSNSTKRAFMANTPILKAIETGKQKSSCSDCVYVISSIQYMEVIIKLVMSGANCSSWLEGGAGEGANKWVFGCVWKQAHISAVYNENLINIHLMASAVLYFAHKIHYYLPCKRHKNRFKLNSTQRVGGKSFTRYIFEMARWNSVFTGFELKSKTAHWFRFKWVGHNVFRSFKQTIQKLQCTHTYDIPCPHFNLFHRLNFA